MFENRLTIISSYQLSFTQSMSQYIPTSMHNQDVKQSMPHVYFSWVNHYINWNTD